LTGYRALAVSARFPRATGCPSSSTWRRPTWCRTPAPKIVERRSRRSWRSARRYSPVG